MRTFLLILTTALLTALWLIYVQTSNLFPEFFSLLPLPSYVSNQPGDIEWTISPTGADCTTPRGKKVTHGEVFLSFASVTGSVSEGWCESRSTVCINGTRSAEQEPLTFETCTLETPKTCEVAGFIFSHGSSQEFFSFDEDEQTCNAQERTCTDGVVDWDEAYTYLSCPSSCAPVAVGSWSSWECPNCPCLDEKPEIKQATTITTKPEIKQATITTKPVIKQVTQPLTTLSLPSEPNCPGPFWWTRREPGQQGSAYKQAVASYGTTCEKVNIVCAFWSIRYGTKDKAWEIAWSVATSCRVADPIGCESACGPVDHNKQTTTYKQAIIPNGNGQVCEDLKIVSTCSDGKLSPAWWTSCSCQVAPPAACTAPNGQAVTHGSSLTLYEFAQVQAVAWDGADTCNRQWRKCQNGTFIDAGGSQSSFTYKYSTCTVIAPN